LLADTVIPEDECYTIRSRGPDSILADNEMLQCWLLALPVPAAYSGCLALADITG